MSYKGLKWKKFKFTLHPTEFEAIFKDLDYFIAITNKRVDENYQISDKTSIFSQYKSFYLKITSGEEWKDDDWKLDIHTSITDHPKNIKYEVFKREEDGEIKTFKRSIQMVPVINISPFSLMIDHKERLSIAFCDSKRNSNIGLEISYPKEFISLKSKKVFSTENLAAHKLYLELIKRIKKVSNKARANRNNIKSKPNFYISSKCINEINRNVMMIRNSITLE